MFALWSHCVRLNHKANTTFTAAELGVRWKANIYIILLEVVFLALTNDHGSDKLAKILIHVTTSPEDQTKAALSFLVAKTALSEGHEVNLFLAGESVRLLDSEILSSVQGKGTGSLNEHFRSIVESGGRFYLSGMSAKARGYDEKILDGKPAEFAMPDVLVKLLIESDKALTY